MSRDFLASISVFFVSITLSMGIAIACNIPVISGIISGFIGGVVVGILSKSHTSVSGPDGSLIAIIILAISSIKSYDVFLCAVIFAGIVQILFAVFRFGIIANYIPSSVIRGFLGAIGIIIIIKQLPHLIGYDADIQGDLSFFDIKGNNSISSILKGFIHGTNSALYIGLLSLILIFALNKYNNKIRILRSIPSAIFVVLFGILLAIILGKFSFHTHQDMFVQIGNLDQLSLKEIFFQIPRPKFEFSNINVYIYGLYIAFIASIGSMLNIESADKLDPKKRYTDPNKELLAQGIGNAMCGLFGGMPIASGAMRTSVNITSNAQTKLSAIIHGVWILLASLFLCNLINKIPLASLAAVLIATGYRLIKISVLKDMYKRGPDQFIPFILTLISIVFVDVVLGIVMGISIGIFFVLKSHYKNPFNLKKEQHHVGEILRIDLPQQVSFLNKNAFVEFLNAIPRKSKIVIDASHTRYIDYDILNLIKEFKVIRAPLKNIKVNLIGFKKRYKLDKNQSIIQFTDVVTKDLQEKLNPNDVIKILKDGNERFMKNKRLSRDLMTQVKHTSANQSPMAVVLSCIDSRSVVEAIFDLGFGDIFSIRMAGNIVNQDVVGNMEFACKVAGAKLIVVLGHTNCGAIKAACDDVRLDNLNNSLDMIKSSIKHEDHTHDNRNSSNDIFVKNVTYINAKEMTKRVIESSEIIKQMLQSGAIKIVYGVYDIETGVVDMIDE
jgi:carbonic anhydrase